MIAMKRTILSIVTVVLFALMLTTTSITVHAEGFDWQAYYENAKAKREQREKEFMEKWLDELEADGNLTPEAIKAAGKYGEGRVPNHKSNYSSADTYSNGGSGTSSYSGSGKGWVYSCDELHVIGLPEGENGYTKPGWYGDID